MGAWVIATASVVVFAALGFAMLRAATRQRLLERAGDVSATEERGGVGRAGVVARAIGASVVIALVAMAAWFVPTTMGWELRAYAVALAMIAATWPALGYVGLKHDRGWKLAIGPLVLGCEVIAASLGLHLAGAILIGGAFGLALAQLVESGTNVRSAPGAGGGTFPGGPGG